MAAVWRADGTSATGVFLKQAADNVTRGRPVWTRTEPQHVNVFVRNAGTWESTCKTFNILIFLVTNLSVSYCCAT